MITGSLWAVFTVLAAIGQTLRNAMQRELTATLGTIGATHVRFLFGLPFAVLFLTGILLATGESFPALSAKMMSWTIVGAGAQIAATALLLAAMRDKSFVLVIALSKIEPVHVALFGLLFLGDRLTPLLALAIAVATLGVVVMSWPQAGARENLDTRALLLGLAAGAVFGLSAVGYRGGILALQHQNYAVAASTTLVVGLVMQVVAMTTYILVRERATLTAIFKAWRPSVTAGLMGAAASQMWFLAFALESAAKVRTLALVEIFFAQVVSRSLFSQSLASREGVGILLIIAGVVALLNL